MGFRRLAAWMVVVSSVSILAACGGSGSGSSGGNAQLRLVNASSAYSSLDLTVGETKVATGVAYGKANEYASVTAGSSVTATVQSGSTSLASIAPTLAKDNHYSLITYGWVGNMRSTILQEEETAPDTNYSKLLVLNLAADAGALDVYLTQNVDNLSSTTPNVSGLGGGSSSGYLTVGSGTYRVRITGTGKNTDLRLDIPSVALDSKQVSTLVITPTQGGVLVNSVRVIQQSSVSVAGNNNARARVIAALDGAKVSATLDSTALMSDLAAPKIGDYQLLSAGNPSLVVTVNGVALPATTPALTAGNDYSFLVWGPVSAPQVTVLSDDNRLPTVSGTAKIRLINGLAGSSTGLTMTLDYGAVVSNVLPGTASAAASINASATGATSLLNVDSTPAMDATLSVVSGGIYNVYIMGSAGNAVRVLRKDR